jgi:sporulation protein YhbH
MAIFRESITGPGRATEDRRRHRQLVEQSIKKNIGQIVAEESIIGQSGRKKIKVPIKSIKEFQFIYGKNRHGVGTGSGQEQRGDVLDQNHPGQSQGQSGQGAGSEAGEDIYETEITLEELVNYLFDDLDLPFLERHKIADMDTIANKKRSGYQHKGPPPRLAKRKAMVEKIKRKQGTRRAETMNRTETETNEPPAAKPRFPFRDEDLRYRRIREEHVPESNAVVICIMDTSGSMDQTKKYLARSFYFLLYQFIRLKYLQVEVVFISHTTQAMEVNEDEFFHKGESGGTYISSGYEKTLRIIEERYPPEKWNIYAFHCSDGDNWEDDNEKAVKLAGQLCKICNLFGYGEIMTGYSSMKNIYREKIRAGNFAIVSIGSREDIWPALRDLLAREDKS